MNYKNLMIAMIIIFVQLMFLKVPILVAHIQVFDICGREIPQNQYYKDTNCTHPLSENSPKSSGIIDFASYVVYPTGSWPEVVATGDLNNDSLIDVVLGTSFYFDSLNDYKIFVFTQNRDGELNSPVKYDGGDIRAIDIGDLNGDSLMDVVAGLSNDSVGIYFQNGSGTLEPMVSYYSGQDVDGVKIGDLNNDGLMDMAVCHWNSDFIRIFQQEPYGIFDSSITYPIQRGGYDEIDVADVTGDGLDDVIFMRGQLYANENITIFAQDTTGLLLSPVFYHLGDTLTHGVAVGDVNFDGRNDVVATYGGNWPSSNIAVWLQDTSGTLQHPPTSYPCYDCPEPVEIADLDLDGLNDVVVANGGWMAMSVYKQNQEGNLESYINFPIPYATHYQPQGLAISDINNDGKPDVVIADYNHGLVVLRNTSYTSVEESPGRSVLIPIDFALLKNYPNPFNSWTTIQYSLCTPSKVTIKIYNLQGQEVTTLYEDLQSAGIHLIRWRPKNISSGTYFYKIEAEQISATKKCLLLR